MEEIIEQVKNGLTVLNKFHVEPPFIFFMSFHNVKGGEIKDNDSWSLGFMVATKKVNIKTATK